MSSYLRIIQSQDIPEILDFEMKKLKETSSSDMEAELASWNARWRKEALEHYFPLGWSFLARDKGLSSSWSDEGLLVGYFMAQPMLFTAGHTQSLWVEHIQYTSLQIRDELCETAYKLSREKHFQMVYFPNIPAVSNAIKPYKALEWKPDMLCVKTTK